MDSIESENDQIQSPEEKLLSIRPYIWHYSACRSLVERDAPDEIIERIRNGRAGRVESAEEKRKREWNEVDPRQKKWSEGVGVDPFGIIASEKDTAASGEKVERSAEENGETVGETVSTNGDGQAEVARGSSSRPRSRRPPHSADKDINPHLLSDSEQEQLFFAGEDSESSTIESEDEILIPQTTKTSTSASIYTRLSVQQLVLTANQDFCEQLLMVPKVLDQKFWTKVERLLKDIFQVGQALTKPCLELFRKHAPRAVWEQVEYQEDLVLT